MKQPKKMSQKNGNKWNLKQNEVIVGQKPMEAYLIAAMGLPDPVLMARGRNTATAIQIAARLQTMGFTVMEWRLVELQLESRTGRGTVPVTDLQIVLQAKS